MNRVMKVVVIASAILGLGIGGVLGAHSGATREQMTEEIQILEAEQSPSEFAAIQCQHADASHARSAVLFEIRSLESLQRLKPTESGGGLWIAYTRLGMIEESAGQAAATHSAFDQARAWAKRPHPAAPDMSDQQLKDALLLYDQRMKDASQRLQQVMKKVNH